MGFFVQCHDLQSCPSLLIPSSATSRFEICRRIHDTWSPSSTDCISHSSQAIWLGEHMQDTAFPRPEQPENSFISSPDALYMS